MIDSIINNDYMMDIVSDRTKLPIIILLIIALLPMMYVDTSARKHKTHYKRETVRQQAIDLLRSNSKNLCDIAGLEPTTGDSANFTDEEAEIGELGEDIAELEREDDVSVDIELFKTLWLSYVADDEEDEATASGVKKSDIMDEIMDWLGTHYRFGGSSKDGIDCSAFVRTIFLNTAEVMLPRTAHTQFTVGDDITRRNLEFGDLVFFHTRSRVYVSHVGIYLGDNLFAHASSKYGVTISSLESTYYNNRFIGGRRITVEDLQRFSVNEDYGRSMSAQ